MESGIHQLDSLPIPEALLGHWHPLLEQLGSPDPVAMLNASTETLFCPRINDLSSLCAFLESYQHQLLYKLEWPAIVRAHACASNNQVRELIALDRAIGEQDRSALARASRRIGQRQLQRLRPIRDHRVVQRYLEAVDAKQAHGWHTLVYGLMLAVYSLPIRQGLITYARQTLSGFIEAAARPLQIPSNECQAILERQCFDMAAQLEKLMQGELK